MANLNLSQFTEKTFVADADWTFVWDTAGAISKKVSRNNWLNSGTITTDAPVTISQTWNAVAQTFKALVVNAAGTSDANSASGSLLADFQVGGVSKAWVTKQGGYRASNGQFVSGNGIGFAGGLNTGFYSVAGEQIFVAANNAVPIEFKSTSIVVNSTATFGFGQVGVGADTILLRDGAANTLALRNGTNAQMFRVYGTYPDGSSYRRLAIGSFNGTEFDIQTEGAGTGAAAGPLNFGTVGVRRMTIGTTGNVGIGTTAPATTLEVNGSLRITGVGQFGPTSTYYGLALFRVGTSTMAAQIYGDVNGLQFTSNGGADTVRILNSGNVGIGTTAPSSKLHVDGVITVTDIYPAPNVQVSSNDGFNIHAGGTGVTVSGVQLAAWTANEGAWINSAYPLSWGNSRGNKDTVIQRDGEADHLAMRRSTNGQKFSVYGTYPGAAWERFTITAPTSGNVLLGTYKGTGGIARGLELQTDGVTRMTIDSAGAASFGTNSVSCQNVILPAGGLLVWAGTGRITNPSTGVFQLLDGAQTSFNRLQFGGTTDSFPAIARDGAGIKFTGAAAGSTSHIKVPAVAVGSLPSATTAGVGARAFVNDATSPVFGSAVTGGGAVPVPVYSTGSAWNVG